MAGTVSPAVISHRSRGLVRLDLAVTCDAAGAASATLAGLGFGRLVGIAAAGKAGDLISISDGKTGAALCSLRLGSAFGNTTTGDTTGGVSEDLYTTGAAHGLVAHDVIVFSSITGGGGTGVVVNTPYWVVDDASLAATTFSLAASLADSTAGTIVIKNVGTADISAATWYKVAAATRYIRPSTAIVDNAGAAVAAADTAPNVNRDILLGGKVKVAVVGGNSSGTSTVSLLIDEDGIGDLALTV
jgi:hypothetical protein